MTPACRSVNEDQWFLLSRPLLTRHKSATNKEINQRNAEHLNINNQQ